MRYAIYRLTAPILDRIPDISHQPKGRQISIGVLASIIIHLLLLLFAVSVSFLLPEHSIIKFMQAKPKLQEIEITVLPSSAPEPELRTVPLEEPPPFIDSRGLNPADKPPESATFQSGRDMKAASEVAPKGDLPLPSQEGRVAPNAPEFEQQKLGKTTPPAAPAAPPVPSTEVPAPPDAKAPDSTAKEMPGAEKETQLKQVEKPAEDEIAVELKPKTGPPPKPRMRTGQLAMLAPSTPPPVPPAPTQQPANRGGDIQAEKTRVEGNINNRGPAAVNAKSTPLGRYNEGVARLIGSRWNFYIKEKGENVALGSVRVFFSIDRRGRVTGVRSEDNTSNSAFAAICEKAVLDSKFQPPGPDLTDVLDGGKLDITFTFTLY